MRVISQDEAMDIPYDIGYFIIESGKYKDTEYVCIKCNDTSFTYRIAEYTSKEKALKVMELMRTQYRTFTDTSRVKGMYAVFQFPQDDEVEI